eukprot:7460933-Alexandrium_andersonii.AAC.1
MSASLVGSEMCIRDRPRPLPLRGCYRPPAPPPEKCPSGTLTPGHFLRGSGGRKPLHLERGRKRLPQAVSSCLKL